MDEIYNSNTFSEIDSILKSLLKKFENLSGSELAKRTGLPISTVNRIISGTVTDPRISTLKPLADYFGITVDQLLGFKALPSNYIDNNNLEPSMVIPLYSIQDSEIQENLKKKWFTWVTKKSDKNINSFALCLNTDEFEPVFEKETTLIIEPQMLPPKHLDYLLVKLNDENKSTIRRYYIDGNDEYLMPLNKQLQAIRINEKLNTIVGIITEAHTKLR